MNSVKYEFHTRVNEPIWKQTSNQVSKLVWSLVINQIFYPIDDQVAEPIRNQVLLKLEA